MIDPLTPPYQFALTRALDELRQEEGTTMPPAYQDAVLSVLERHPFREGQPFEGPDPELCHAVVRVCGQWRLESAYGRLCELLHGEVPDGMAPGHVASARHTLIKALVQNGPRPRTIASFRRFLDGGDALERDHALRALLRWDVLQEEELSRIPIDELFRLAHEEEDRRSRKRARALLVRRFRAGDPEHRLALQCHFDPEQAAESFRPYELDLNSSMNIYRRRELLRFLGSSAPPEVRSSVLERRARELLAAYLEPIVPGCLPYIYSSHFAYLVCSEIAAGALWRQRSEEEDDAALLAALHSQRRGIQKNAYHGLLRRKQEALPMLRKAMEEKPPYQPGEWPRGIGAPRDPITFLGPEERSQRLLGRLYGRLLFGEHPTELERMSALREILTLPANDATWAALCAFLNGWCRHSAFEPEVVYGYVNEHLETWSDDLREAPHEWWDFLHEPIPRPWPMIRRVHLGGSSLFGHAYYGFKDLSERQKRAIARLLVQSAPLTHCTQLLLHSCWLTDEAFRELLAQHSLGSLQLLQLDDNRLGRATLNTIANDPNLTSLRYLSFRRNKDLILKTPKRLQEQKPELVHVFFS